MFRLLGFIIGSLVSIAALVIMIGMPNFHLGGEQADEDRYEAAIEKLLEKQQAAQEALAELPVEDFLEEALPVVESAAVAAAEALSDAPAETTADAPPEATGPPEEVMAETPFVPEPEPVEAQVPAEPTWHSFWTPFRSEIAAEGFVRQLESVTGLDYRIVKVRTGVYQVAFPYVDDVERETKLSQIATATGLDLSDTLR